MTLRQAIIQKKSLFFVGIILLVTLVISRISQAESDLPVDFDPTPRMEKGKIVFDIKTKAASNDNRIRYRTTGFTISLSPQNKTVTAKGLTGPDAPPVPSIQLPFDEKEVLLRTKDYVITQFRISRAKVRAAVLDISGIDLDNISETTYVYLHGIFETYQIANDEEVKRKTGISTWKDIVNAEPWEDPSIFNPYFNIKVKFDPGPQDNKLYFVVNGNIAEKQPLNKLNIGENLIWQK